MVILDLYNKDTIKPFYDLGLDKVPGCYLAGGSLISQLSVGHPVNDFDLFFRDRESADAVIALLDEQLKHDILEAGFLTSTYSGVLGRYGRTYTLACGKFQVLDFEFFQYGVLDILESFDFTICSIVLDDNKLYTNEETWRDLTLKRLSFNPNFDFKVNYSTGKFVHRIEKYVGMGFYLPYETIKKVHENLNVMEEYYTENM